MTQIKDMPVLPSVPVGGYVLVTDPTSGPAASIFAKVPGSSIGGSGTVNTGPTGTIAYYAGFGTAVSPLTLGTNLSISGTTLNATGGTVNTGPTGTIAYYAGFGTAVSPLTLGTNLSITGTTLNATGGGGSGTDASTLTVGNSTAVATLTFSSTVQEAVYDVTLTANWVPILAGTVASKYRRILLIIRGGAGGFTFTMPTATPGSGTVVWTGGAGAPAINTAAGALNRIWFETTNAGVTVLAGY